MIIDGPQSSHASVGDIGAVLGSDVIMLHRHFGWIQAKLLQRQIEPFFENALNMIAIAFDGSSRCDPCGPYGRPGIAPRLVLA